MNAPLMLQLQRHWLILGPIVRRPHRLFVLMVADYCWEGTIFRGHTFNLIWDVVCLLCFQSAIRAEIDHWVLASLLDWLLILGSSLSWLILLLVEQRLMVVVELGLQSKWWLRNIFNCRSHSIFMWNSGYPVSNQAVCGEQFSMTAWTEGDPVNGADFRNSVFDFSLFVSSGDRLSMIDLFEWIILVVCARRWWAAKESVELWQHELAPLWKNYVIRLDFVKCDVLKSLT